MMGGGSMCDDVRSGATDSAATVGGAGGITRGADTGAVIGIGATAVGGEGTIATTGRAAGAGEGAFTT